jgi:hypothetical protein
MPKAEFPPFEPHFAKRVNKHSNKVTKLDSETAFRTPRKNKKRINRNYLFLQGSKMQKLIWANPLMLTNKSHA